MCRRFLFIAFSCCLVLFVQAQNIRYSQPDREDIKGLNFEIIGKMNGNFLIYKNIRSSHKIDIYDNEMKVVASEKLSFINDKVINTDILAYKNFFYVIYQYQRRNVIYCMGAKMDSDGKIVGEPMELDTTQISFLASNKVFSFISSEDKQRVGFVKINTKNPDAYTVTSVVFDNALKLLGKSVMNVPMPDNNDFLTEFSIDNDGDIAFVRASGASQKDNISKLTLITKNIAEDEPKYYDLAIDKMYLDDVRLKVDNINKTYLLASFYTKSRRGNVDGLYATLFSKNNAAFSAITTTTFSDDLRNNAKSEGNAKFAFNDFFLQNIVMRKDGGFVIAAESVYSSSRGNQYNRWDYYNSSPFYSPYSSYGYYSPYSPYGSYYPWNRNGFGYQNTRYFADNVAVLSFDSTATLSWSNVIHKSQFDDNSDDFIGYITMNTGSEVHFLYNETVKKNVLLSDQSVTPDGEVHHSPTLRNLDRGYEFMPRLGKQVGSKQMIIPCSYRSYICFAKVDF